MKVVCEGLALGGVTTQVIKAISSRTTNPILEGIKLTAENGKLILSATDLELGIEKTIRAEVKEEGETVIPGKFFSEFIKKLSNEQIELTLNEKNQLKIKYTDSETYIQCLNVLEFPNLKQLKMETSSQLLKRNLKNL